jgi:hypothetical protein
MPMLLTSKSPFQSGAVLRGSGRVLFLLLGFAVAWLAQAADGKPAAHFRQHIQPILNEFCFDCHGDGMDKGKVAFDTSKSDEELIGKRDLWLAVLKNVRAGLMPPEKKAKPSAEQVRTLESWIKRDVFELDPADPDPGRVTLRRLNRVEYRNTIRDLMGFDFKATEEFPPDDTGYGFDNIGDVLTVSPLLLEKYMQAAETIVAGAVPRVGRAMAERTIPGGEFRRVNGDGKGDSLTFYKEAATAHAFKVEQAGDYKLVVELNVAGEFDFDPGRCRVVFKVNDQERKTEEFGWQNGKRFTFEFPETLEPGEHRVTLELQPLVAVEKKVNSLDLRVNALRVQGPVAESAWVRPKNFELFFTQDSPADPAGRAKYAREVLQRFTTKAFRRPADERTIERLTAIAAEIYGQPGKKFEDGIAQALVAVLASPRFLFRVEGEAVAKSGSRFAPVDEYALASRLSYFLWSTMPDTELFRLAERGELRSNLGYQVKRMLADKRANEFIENFTGQWLQIRDVDGIDINARVVLARDRGEERELNRIRQEFLAQQTNRVLNGSQQQRETDEQRARRRRFFAPAGLELDRPLREAMRRETEMQFAHVVREDRPLTELVNPGYTFLNERLAKHYGLTNLNVTGSDMRRVELPPDSPRGGVLTHGSVLVVTSNPTRTSPVKRGLFVLDNLLGTPPPPPPADVPDLEEAEKEFKDREPTLRETLELHRSKPICTSCHARMDPLGLALENFNALGMWRDKERNQAIDTSSQLITGEKFSDIRELKRVVTNERRTDFHRCLTEKLLTYALGRGLEYQDVETVDRIVAELERDGGRFSTLLTGVIESAPFQKRRVLSAAGTPAGKPASPVQIRARLTP